jgi:hypothetical protein
MEPQPVPIASNPHFAGSNTLRVVSECIYIITHFACFVKAYLKNGFRFYISESILPT